VCETFQRVLHLAFQRDNKKINIGLSVQRHENKKIAACKF